MCNIWKKTPQTDELTIRQIDTFFSKARQLSWVGITGGEPFLRGDLPEVAEIIIGHCHNLSALQACC
jgi:molybdenum cofactor biosynthesis enzyme MoaA